MRDSHPFDIVDAVLQTQNDSAACQMRRDGARRILGIDGFDAEQNPPGVPHSGGIGAGANRNGLRALGGFKPQTIPRDRFDVLRAADQRDVRAGPR